MIIEHDREWIKGCIRHDGFIKTNRADKANQIILKALQQTEWIPVTERLPEENGDYITTTAENEIECSYYDAKEKLFYDTHLDEVIAWMPLPEPYKDNNE